MHLLLIHQMFGTPSGFGGTRHYELSKYTIEKGDKITVIAGNRRYRSGLKVVDNNKLINEQYLDGIRILRAYIYPALHKGFIGRVLAFVSFMITSLIASFKVKNVDIVMGTSPQMFQAVTAWFVSTVRRKPFLLEIRDLWPEFAIDMGILKNPVLIFFGRKLEGFLYSQATHILVNSPAYRDYIIGKGYSPEKVTLIPNGVDPELFDPRADGNGFRKQFDLDGKFIVTYAGALSTANDIPAIINAANILRENDDIRFLLIGDGKDQQKLERMVRSLGLENVVFTGAFPKLRMPEILAASDACIATLQNIPAFKTTYPNKVFDYMAAGRPTVLAIDGVIRDVIEKANGGIYAQPGSAGDIADAILKLSTDRNYAREMGANARQYVEKEFNRNVHTVDFYMLLKKVAGEKIHEIK